MFKELVEILPFSNNLSVMFQILQPKLIGELLYKFDYSIVDIYENSNKEFKDISKKIYNICSLSNINYKKNLPYYSAKAKYDLNIMFPFIAKELLENYKENMSEIESNSEFNLIKSRNINEVMLKNSLSHLNEDGYMIGIVPSGFLTNNKNKNFRNELQNDYQILSIIELPSKKLFKSIFSSIKISIIIVRKSDDSQKEVFLAKFENENFEEEKNNLLKEFNNYIQEEFNNENR